MLTRSSPPALSDQVGISQLLAAAEGHTFSIVSGKSNQNTAHIVLSLLIFPVWSNSFIQTTKGGNMK